LLHGNDAFLDQLLEGAVEGAAIRLVADRPADVIAVKDGWNLR
jgi:hypothetical protein